MDIKKVENLEIPQPSSETEPVPEPVDCVVHVSISGDRLAAFVNIDPPENGGAAPTVALMEAALDIEGVTYGINRKKLQELEEKPCYRRKIRIAEGKKEINGTDGAYEILFNTSKDFKPKVRADGTVDFQDLGIVNNVEKGQALCKITLPTDGVEGISVTGEKRLPIKGRAAPYLIGRNTELIEQGTQIIATKNGHADFIGGAIHVNETYYVNGDVDHSTGNIKVIGNIVINGMVLSGFSVEAEGSIEINGSVESATLISGGNMLLRSGINGSVLTCSGDFNGKFIENSNVTVRGNIRSGYIMNSDIHCGKNLEITGMFARFSGGSCVVGNDMIAPNIGTSFGVKTYLQLGVDPKIVERQQELIKDLPDLEKQISMLERLILLLEQIETAGRLDNEKKETLQEARHSLEVLSKRFTQENHELVMLNHTIETNECGRIICKRTIYPGTIIKIGGEQLSVTDPLHHVMVYFSDGEIRHGPAI